MVGLLLDVQAELIEAVGDVVCHCHCKANMGSTLNVLKESRIIVSCNSTLIIIIILPIIILIFYPYSGYKSQFLFYT